MTTEAAATPGAGTVTVDAGELVAFGMLLDKAQKSLALLGAAESEWMCEPCRTTRMMPVSSAPTSRGARICGTMRVS